MPGNSARRLEVTLAVALCGCSMAFGACAAPETEAPRDPPRELPMATWSGVYKADLLGVKGPRLSSAVGNLNLRVDFDGAALLGWDDATALHAELLWNHGGKPNRRVATAQGISNLEVAQNSARVYASWIEHTFKTPGTQVLVGLYDLNSEFYATDASTLLIHPSFGIGIDFSQSGRNGPSIFPNLGLAVRVRQPLGAAYYLQTAVIDGVPGDPRAPGRAVIHLSRADGALVATEFGWQERGADGPKAGHWGVGAWFYSQRAERIDGGAPEHNHGVYALAQAQWLDTDAGRITGFVRAGAANRRVNAIDLALDAGVLLERPVGRGGPSAITAGVAIARFGRAQRDAQAALGVTGAATETALEIGARWTPAPLLAAQPLLQRVWHPGGRRDTAATIAGVRLEWSWGASPP